MKRTAICLLLAITSTTSVLAQKYSVKGKIIEEDTKEVVPMATIQVLSLPDSAYVTGMASGLDGTFNIKSIKKGKYVLKISYIGFQNYTTSLDFTNSKQSSKDLGIITLTSDAKLLESAVVTAQAAQVQVSGDSIIYNSSAFRVPEGSALEELVKKLPGADVDENGKITINGKEVSKILIDGKEFFTDDTDVAMKNLPTSMVDKIKAYDRKSDLARVTGIDDGEEETVLDLTVKKGMDQAWIGNVDLSIGTKDRYAEKIMINRFTNKNQMSLVGSMNNTNDMGFPGGGGGPRWGARNGLITSKMAGFNFATTSDKLETNGNIRYRYKGTDSETNSATQNFVTSTGAFSNSRSKNLSNSSSVNADFKLEWKPDTMTNIIFRPNGSYSVNNGYSSSSSATFNSDPNELSDDPLADADSLASNIVDYIVNTNASIQQTYSDSKSINASLQANRKLSSNGRNITFRASGGLSGSESKQLSASRVLYTPSDPNAKAPTYNNRYYTTPGESNNYSLQLTYSEPIWKQTYLQFSYKFSYSYNKNDRKAFIYDSQAYKDLQESLANNKYDIDAILDFMQESGYEQTLSDSLSQFSEYRNYNHDIELMFRVIRKKYNFNVGVKAMPQYSTLNYKYMGKEYPEIDRDVFNITPTLDFRYKFSDISQLRFNYRGRTSQPSMTNLLDITDDSDPLNIKKGNPGLKPSFTNTFRLFYNNFIPDRQQSYMTHIYFSTTKNDISNMISYDETTGVKTTQPMNINGNWNIGGMFNFNTALDHDHYYTVNTFTSVRYNNQVSYLDPQQYDINKSKTRQLNLGERLSLGYRNDWFEFTINGNINYSHSRNNVVESSNLDTYNFSYGFSTNIYMPWGTKIATDLSQNSRRGYSQSSMNTNELLWNAQISHSMLKNNALTISLQIYDILGQQSNISRTINAMMSSDTEYNSINQYAMLHVIYKLNLFGGKTAGQNMPGGGFGPGRRGPGGGMGPGRPH